jgi:cell division protein ZapA
MPDDNLFKIQLKVAQRTYPLICKRSEEGLFRKAARDINEKILRYGSVFPAAKLELKDLLAMVAIHISANNLKMEQNKDTSPLFDRIEALDKELEEYLSVNA